MDFAREIITRFHNKTAADQAHENFEKTFRDKGIPDDIETWSVQDMPDTISVPHLLKESVMVATTSEGMRMLDQGGVSFADAMGGQFQKISGKEMAKSELIGKVIRVGKRKFKKLV